MSFATEPAFGRQGDADRQSGAACRRRRRGNALSGARTVRCGSLCSAAARARAIMAESCRAAIGRLDAGSAGAACRRPAGARGGSRPRARGLRRHLASPPKSRRSSPICRRAWRRAIWWCRAPGHRPSPSSPRSAGRRSWCRCRTRSIRTSSPMPASWNGPAARCGWCRSEFTPQRLAAEIARARGGAGAARRDGGGGAQPRPARCRRPARRPGAAKVAERAANQ